MSKKIALILTSEHGVNTVPKEYEDLFAPYQLLLHTHRGVDFGSLALAQHLQRNFQSDFVQAQTTRLLIDCNRSLSHPNCFSEITSLLNTAEKQRIIKQFYLPYRQSVENLMQNYIEQGQQILHLSLHSFTPIFNYITRKADIGLLYDPRRQQEKKIANDWQKLFKQEGRGLIVRKNYPYLGISNGFVTILRKKFSPEQYLGIEVEINQALVKEERTFNHLAKICVQTLKQLITAIESN